MSEVAPTSPRFLADVMLGTLARWLRILGYDTAYDNRIEDRELLRRCLQENRVALTRDRLLIQQNRLPHQLLIESEPLFEQIREVLAFLGDAPNLERLLTRCLECNALLVEVAREKVRNRIPPYVFQTQSRFKECPACHKIYWAGTHRQNIYARLKARL